MKQISIFIAFLFFASSVAAQTAFSKDDKLLSIGLGLGTPYWGSGYSSGLPVNPMVTFESGVTENISVGGSLGYSSSKYDFYDLRFNGFYIGARGAYHFDLSRSNTDVYAGAGLGYVIVSVGSKDYGNVAVASSGTGYTAFAGGRYFFGRKAAVYAELGYGSFSILNAGLTFKF